MRRKIEEVTKNRKNAEQKLEEITDKLAEAIENLSLSGKKGRIAAELILEFKDRLKKLVTIQDREWDLLSNNHYTEVFNSLQTQINDLKSTFHNLKSVSINFIELEQRLNNVINKLPESSDPNIKYDLEELRSELSMLQYSDFEERFRGTKKDILERQKKYIRFFSGSKKVLDIGCGRGEFMKLLVKAGIEAEGVDLSSSMLKEAEKEGLNCIKSDALNYLKNCKPDTFDGIFSAQVIEHLSPDYLKDMVSESFRVLKKSGILLLETINPLSVFAMTNIYYLDVTHKQPLHPEFMRYLLGTYGFERIEIKFSDPPAELQLDEIPEENEIAVQFNSNRDKLNKILFSSPDYAILGKKP